MIYPRFSILVSMSSYLAHFVLLETRIYLYADCRPAGLGVTNRGCCRKRRCRTGINNGQAIKHGLEGNTKSPILVLTATNAQTAPSSISPDSSIVILTAIMDDEVEYLGTILAPPTTCPCDPQQVVTGKLLFVRLHSTSKTPTS